MSGPAVCDYSYARPDPAVIKAAGYLGVVRYLSWQPNAKNITSGELAALWGAGLDVALVWETGAQAASGGYPIGHSEGAEALRQANALGWPSTRPVYFVMEDPNQVPTSQWSVIEEYCHGLQDAGWPLERIGGYGSQALIEHLHTSGFISWGWQVEGWSATVSAVCHLYQRDTPTLAPAALVGSIDEDAVLQADWGGWNGQTISPTPSPSPAPVAAPSSQPTLSGGPMPSILVRLPVGPSGEGWGVFDGGTNVDPGSASLNPAIPFSQFVSLTPWADDPASDHPDIPTPQVGIQDRGGFVFVKVTGAQPGPATAVGHLVYTPT
jgi:hypothetical protein